MLIILEYKFNKFLLLILVPRNEMGKIVFYYTLLSPPSRAVLLTGKALGIEFDLKNVDLIKGEHLSDEFKKVI